MSQYTNSLHLTKIFLTESRVYAEKLTEKFCLLISSKWDCHSFDKHMMLSSSNIRQQHFISMLLPWKSLYCHIPSETLFSCLEGSSYFVKMVTDTSLFASFIFLWEIQSRVFKFLLFTHIHLPTDICLNHALIQDPRFTNSQINFLLCLRVFFSLHAAHKTCIGSAYFCLATHETRHKPPSNFKDNNLQEEAAYSSMRASFYRIFRLGSLRVLSSFNEMFLDELTWILLVPNDLIYLPEQDKFTGLVLVRVTVTSVRGEKARDEGSAELSCVLMNSHLPFSSFLTICYPT